ncbi:MAG TPA: DUF2585 family protein [Candidatus Binataceae bacterium]|nr:DUF2585 family protein [Candidatus Binataceae bacterium]
MKDSGSRFPLWACAAGAASMFAVAAAVERAMGRSLWGISGQPGIWSGEVNSEHNSQYLFDPYTFSHITHGMLWYGSLWLVARKLPPRVRILIAIAIESMWEMVENTDFVIQRYRAATISQHYYGDSIMNSMCDILACVAGLMLAYLLPARLSIVFVVVLEMTLALWIRDNLALNVVMLIHPFQVIRTWQAGG